MVAPPRDLKASQRGERPYAPGGALKLTKRLDNSFDSIKLN